MQTRNEVPTSGQHVPNGTPSKPAGANAANPSEETYLVAYYQSRLINSIGSMFSIANGAELANIFDELFLLVSDPERVKELDAKELAPLASSAFAVISRYSETCEKYREYYSNVELLNQHQS